MAPMIQSQRFAVLLFISFVAGLAIGWVDSRPTWDDTGITAGSIFLVSAAIGALMPSRAWVWGLAVGCGVPLFSLLSHGNPAALVSFVIAFAGSYAGAFSRSITGGVR